MDPVTELGQRKTLETGILDEQTQRDQQLEAIVARARKLRPTRRYPRATKVAAGASGGWDLPTPGTPPTAPTATPKPAAPSPPPAAAAAPPSMPTPQSVPLPPPGAQPPEPSMMQRALGHHGAKAVTDTTANIGQTLGQGGQAVAGALGAGDWYKNLSPLMQQWGIPVGGPLAAMLGMLLMRRMFKGGEEVKLAYTIGSNPDSTGEEALKSIGCHKPKGVSAFAPYETSSSKV